MKKTLMSLVVLLLFGMAPTLARAVPATPAMTHAETGLNITISWTPAAGATGYTLCYAPYPWQPWMTMDDIGYIDMGTATEVSFYLWEGASYYIAVQAYDGQGSSDFSNIDYFIMGPPNPLWIDDDGDGYHENSGDCDDANAAVHPGATEVCGDAVDQDCSGADLGCDPVVVDADMDGYSVAQGDCDDSQASIHPGATDHCENGIDEDCSGADRACLPEEIDNDGDGYAEIHGDCNDADASIHPQTVDICEDGIDQDCSGADRICPQNIDDDRDGYTETQGDCNDSAAAINPGATDLCGDGIDQDCNGSDLVCATTAVMPILAPAGGSFSYGQVVTITSATPDAQIRYTTNGSEPTLTSPQYSAPIPVNSSMTIKALAYKSGMNASPVATETYTVTPSLSGNWTVTNTMGSNSCLQPSGTTLVLNANIVQTGDAVTVTTEYGSGSGTLNGNQGSLTTTQPFTSGSITGTVTLSMNITVDASFRNFSGPATFSMTSTTLNCSGNGTITGTRVMP